MSKYKPADLIFTRSDSALGWAIRFFERHLGEEQTYTNHVAIVGPKAENVIEALWHVVETPLDQWLTLEPHYEVWRNYGIGEGIRDAIAREAKSYVGRHYGWWKIGLHAIDGAISKVLPFDVFLFRRLMFVDKYPICSWVIEDSCHKLDVNFGCPHGTADPDRIHDYVKRKDNSWTMIAKK